MTAAATCLAVVPVAAQAPDFELFQTRDVLAVFDSRGIFLQDPRSGAGLALFPARSPNNYGFGSGLWVGGLLNGQKVVSTAYDAAGGFSEFLPGRAAVNGGGADRILCSDQPEELALWYPEFSDPSTGEPIVLSRRDCVVIYNDANQARDVSTPIGLEVRQRTLQFGRRPLSQVLLVTWEIVNTGDAPLQRAFLGINADMDIGADAGDDRCSALPSLPSAASDAPARAGVGFCWDDDFFETSFDPNPPGFAGVTLFRGPRDRQGRPLPMTSFTITTNPSSMRPQPDPVTDGDQYDLLAGIGARAPYIDPVPTDKRFVAISGPFDLAPGEAQTVVAGYVWAPAANDRTSLDVRPERCFPRGLPCFLPSPRDPALEELRELVRAADATVRLCCRPPET